jgi:hypothetical protein
MNTSPPSLEPVSQRPLETRAGWKRTALIVCCIVLGLCGITAAATAWWVKRNVYASNFKPVMLTQNEQAVFDQKVEQIKSALPPEAASQAPAAPVDPEIAKRTLTVSEKEINAYLAKQGLGEQLKVKLSDGNAIAEVIAPVDPSVMFIGGKTFRIQIALAAGMKPDDKFALSIADVSIGGVPIPNAWLGDIKGVNMLAENANTDPVASRFMAGIKEFEIKSGVVRVLLNK